jgi:cell fate (sporulation/competence/biofilm development) regulator YlbF (YheA/YmcA/DUF963 family)
MCFGEGRPFIQTFLSRVTKEHGFLHDKNKKLVEVDAAVTERYSKYAPITKNIQGKQTIGIGTDDDGEATDASVDINLNEKSDITINSKSALSMLFEKAVSIISKKGIRLKSDNTELIEIGNAVATLGEIINEHLDININFDTTGSPANHKTGPVALAKLKVLQGNVRKVLK